MNQVIASSIVASNLRISSFIPKRIQDSLNFRSFDRFLLTIILIELLYGGNGYLTEIAGVRIRVLFYIICMGWVAIKLLSDPKENIPPLFIKFTCCFFLVTIFSIVIGFLNGNSLINIASEVRGQMYFPMLFFFAVTIKTQEDINWISNLIRVCTILLSLLHLSLLLVIYLGLISYSDVYFVLKKSIEFIFRSGPLQIYFIGFFYSGFIYFGLSTLFFLFQCKKIRLGLSTILVISLALTLTRSVLLATIICALLGIFFIQNKSLNRVLSIVFVAGVGILLLCSGFMIDNYFRYCGGNSEKDSRSYIVDIAQEKKKITSNCFASASNINPELKFPLARATDKIRILDIQFILKKLDYKMFCFGKGFGTPIRKRQRMENGFLEVFYKQGIAGLFFWLSLLGANFFLFWKLKSGKRSEALPFLLSPIFIYLSSIGNNVLTGSIGMPIVLISIVCIYRIIKLDKSESEKHFKLLRPHDI